MLVLAEYTVRTFSLPKEGSKVERIVRQFHFTVWPDHGVPEYPAQLLHFVYKVMLENPTRNGPMVVHCSAGVGRTGTFITLFTQLQRIRAERSVDIFGFVRSMRRRRCYMVQTEVRMETCIQPMAMHAMVLQYSMQDFLQANLYPALLFSLSF